MTWRELILELNGLAPSKLDSVVQFFFNGTNVEGDELLLDSKNNEVSIDFVGPNSHSVVKEELAIGSAYFYVDEKVPEGEEDALPESD